MRRAQVLPVIHVLDVAQAVRNAQLAFDNGADGVFVISMDGRDDELDGVACHLKSRWPDRFIGVNYLTVAPLAALERSLLFGLDGTWTDKPGVTSQGAGDQAHLIRELLLRHPKHKFFGSVAFKYQPADLDPAKAAVNAASLGMVPTTSGTATGVAPSVTKVAAMRRALGRHEPLALASGLTPENVGVLALYLTHLLVSTGVSRSFHEFDADLLARFVAAVPK